MPYANFPQQSHVLQYARSKPPIFQGETPTPTGLSISTQSVVVLHTAEQVFNKPETWILIKLYLLAT